MASLYGINDLVASIMHYSIIEVITYCSVYLLIWKKTCASNEILSPLLINRHKHRKPETQVNTTIDD